MFKKIKSAVQKTYAAPEGKKRSEIDLPSDRPIQIRTLEARQKLLGGWDLYEKVDRPLAPQGYLGNFPLPSLRQGCFNKIASKLDLNTVLEHMAEHERTEGASSIKITFGRYADAPAKEVPARIDIERPTQKANYWRNIKR